MDEVAVSVALPLLKDLSNKGIPFQSILKGTQLTEQFLNKNTRISWETYCKIMENVGNFFNDEELEEMGRNYIYSKPMKKFRTSFRMFFSPKDFYKWLYSPGSPGRQDFTCVYSSVTDLGENSILGILQMEKGYKPCREFFIITKGVISQISRTVGFPESRVEMNLIEDAAYYYITVPEESKVFSIIRYIVKWPINVWLAKKELREALDSLQKAYVEIVHAKNNLELRVEERTAELKEAQKIKEHIFANISHEFRTPLTLIKGPVEKMLADEKRTDIQENYKMILHNTQRLLILVNQLLDLSKIESGKIILHPEKNDIAEIIRNCSASFESLAAQNNIEFSLLIPGHKIEGFFDRDCIEKIIINLLSNAFKFTSYGGKISVALTASDRFIELKISDTGIGIPETELTKIFNRFYQVETSRSTNQPGTGIGLAHTKELVDLHKGLITVTSREGEGSTFTVKLPADDMVALSDLSHISDDNSLPQKISSVDKVVSIGNEDKEKDLESPLLLIIEDNSDMRKYMRMYLDDYYTVIEAVNGTEGVEKAIKYIPDLVICDVMMPKMNGLEVCRKLKNDERSSHIPVILLTAKASLESKLEGLETGADSYLTKPFNSQELLIRSNNLIDQRKKLIKKFSSQFFINPDSPDLPSIDKKFLNKVKEAVEKNFSDEKFGVERLSEEICLSRSQLHRKIIGLINCTPGEFILTIRLRHAVEMIKNGSDSISEIAYATGFNTPNYFAKCFRKKFGCSPSEFKKKLSSE